MNYTGNAPTAQDVNAMQNLINIMNAGVDFNDEPAKPAPLKAPQAKRPNVHSDPNVASMQAIMESFRDAAGDALDDVMEVAKHDRNLTEAMQTHATKTGAIIGAWEVRVHLSESTNSKRKSYDVRQPVSGDVLFERLEIFEAAHAIVRYLNKGLHTTHPKITEIADLEEIYRRNRQDAVVFKKRYERCIELDQNAAAEVFEARHQKARAQAIIASDSIKSILDNIR